ncbi:hypothetical protein [Antarcticirhabdus aurantiaca]|uniref:hypothetical protein n=1 Tax=Antarcticirhabdus aurantiaca TaxID=2606717 RepID=UPI00131EBBF3|nr:hypothetical protein [Antarcticirhabdus aurantiaca]
MDKTRDEKIDAGARFLRETTQAGKNLTPWAETPKAAKKKWLRLAEGVLDAMETTHG